jgi:hypothetical protein
MTTQFQPPPTYADPVIVDEATRKGQFNPLWLKWFLDLAQFINANGGGSAIQHNSLGGLQGGTTNQYYHLNQASYTILNNIGTPTAGGVAYGTGSTVAFSSVGTAGQVLTSSGTGAPTWASLSSSSVTSFSADSTGLTPSTATTGAIVLGGTLNIGHGGTNSTATPTAGAVIYGTGTAYGVSAMGVAGQFLTSGGSGAPTWTNSTAFAGAVGYYGAYEDTTTTTATSSTVDYVIGINTVDIQNGVSIVSGNQVTVANAGIYNLQFSAQFSNPNSSIANISVWFRVNGVDVVNGAGTNGVPAKHGSINALQIIGWNSLFNLNAGDYIQLVWQSDVTGVQLITIPATTGPTVPESPAMIVTIQALSQIGIGYYGETSTTSVTIGTGSKTFTVSIPATSTAFTVGSRVRVAYATTPADFMEGVITSFTGTTMVVNVDLTGGSGTFALWTVSIAGNQGTGAVTSVTATAPVASTGGTTPVISMPAATTSTSGYLTSTDWNTFNGKQPAGSYVTSVSGTAGRITSTGGTTPAIDLASGIATAGTTGSSTLIPVVTIDTYGRVTTITTASNPQGTVTSVAALTLGTTGTDLTSTVANGTTTPVITLNVPTASATNRGALSAADWSTFNGKQPAGTYVTSVTGTAPVVSSGGTTPAISMSVASASANGYLSSTDWSTFNGKQPAGTYVTGVSVVSANGFAGTATSGATPAITLTTTITGLLKGNGTAISAAVANTDYVPLSTVLTKTADYTIANTDAWIINNKTGSALTLTFPAASSWTGRSITVKNMQAQLVNSASSNVVPIDSTTAGTAILLNVIGNWATLVSDGTNWVIMQAASNNNLLLE